MNKKVVFLPYDMDTAIGINNEGALVFGYSLEDTDTIGGSEVFNGQSSVLWNNLRDTFGPEIKQMYQNLRAGGHFSYAEVEKAFEEHQEKWPEAVFNEDAFFKYIKPLIEDNDETYLAMLLGSKAEQRKWWLYNRFRYLDSKYNAADSLSDRILLRGNAKANITITPYADIYATIRWASTLKQVRATRSTAYTMINPLDSLGDTDLYIYSAGQLADLGDLSGLMLSFADFHSGIRLQSIVVGSTTQGYNNTLLRSLNVGNLKLLKKIDARNCSGLGTSNENYAAQKNIDLSGCSRIEEVYFDGTNIGSVTLPNGGFLKKLHLPATVTNLTIRNQTSINEFVCPDYSNITTLFLENSLSLATIASIVDDVAAGCRIRLFNYYWDFNSISDVNTFLAKFEGMTGMDQNGDNTESPQIFATVHVPTATGDQIDAIQTAFPDITVDADVANYYIKYYDTEGNTLLYTETVNKHQNGTWATQPEKAADAQYIYTFVGWSRMRNSSQADSTALNDVTGNRNVYAAYSRVVQTYTITFVRAEEDGGGTLQSSQIAYGQMPSYTGETPTTTKEGDYTFKGWSPAITSVTGNQIYTAKFNDNSINAYKFIQRTITNAFDDEVTHVGSYAFASCASLTTVSFPAVTSIGNNAFQNCSNLTTVSFPAATTIGDSAFNNCSNLTTVSFPEVTSIGGNAFLYCSNLTTVSFPAVTSIGTYAFLNCHSLTTVSFPAATRIGNSAFQNCSNLTTASFPEATTIGNSAFASCSRLTTAAFPAVTSIGVAAFQYCFSLTTISFPAVTSISGYAFQNCSNLTTVSFPAAKRIGSYAFQNCSSLTTASFPAATSISGYAFTNCSRLTTVSFPAVTSIGNNAFQNCSNLTTVSFPAATTIGGSAFRNCYSLTAVSFPAVMTIGMYAFEYCTNLEAFVLQNSSVVASLAESNAFSGANFVNIYVADNLVSAYQSANNWSYYSSQIKGISELLE